MGPNLIEFDEAITSRVALMSGEPRFRWLHTPHGSVSETEELAARVEAAHGDCAWVSTFERIDREGWLGPPIDQALRSRLGDVAVVPFEPVAFMEPGEAAESRLMCRHGSLTAEEMYVPLVASRGRLVR